MAPLDSAPDQQQDLREVLHVLRRRKWLLMALIAGLPALAYLLSASAQKVYTATAIVQVQGTAVDTSLFVPGADTADAGLIAAASRLVKTQEVAAAAAERLDPPPFRGRTGLIDAVSATSETETGFVTIAAESQKADRAADIANAFAAAVVEVRSRQARAQVSETIRGIALQRSALSEADDIGRRELSAELQRLRALRAAQNRNAVIVEPAVAPDEPASPKPLRNAAMAFILAVLMGVALVFLIERLDPRIRRPEQLRRLAPLPVLGSIPRVHGAKRVVALRDSDAFQSLRASLSYFDVHEGARSVVVASPGAGEGRTTVAINLAISLARSGRDVVLIDADLRHPTVAARLGLRQDVPTLGGVRAPGWLLIEALTEIGIDNGRLRVLPGESSMTKPTETIDPEQMRATVRTAEAICDVVIIDSTALLPVSDIVSILRDVSGVILLVRMNRTSRDAVARALEIVELAGGTVLGFVATYVPRGASDVAGGYGRGASRTHVAEITQLPSANNARRRGTPPRPPSEPVAPPVPGKPQGAPGRAPWRRAKVPRGGPTS
jgi:capsular polysaccharide biosynthesis protein/MinD-like ATPase involved in chromosome partitioning or flagellar assembly